MNSPMAVEMVDMPTTFAGATAAVWLLVAPGLTWFLRKKWPKDSDEPKPGRGGLCAQLGICLTFFVWLGIAIWIFSTKVNENPPKTQIWRNYNYPPEGSGSRNPGAFRVNTLTAVRATTAAPTFFTPVQWEKGLYCDGALVANNPCAIALQEAKLLYPGVPIELVISIGTGYNTQSSESTEGMGWDLLSSIIINSSTDTEETDRLLMNFLPPDKYFRFNPVLDEKFDIDVKDKKALDSLKDIGRKAIENMGATPDGKKRRDTMVRLLKGK